MPEFNFQEMQQLLNDYVYVLQIAHYKAKMLQELNDEESLVLEMFFLPGYEWYRNQLGVS